MAPPLSKKQNELLHKIYFDEKFFFGRDKITKYLQEKYPDSDISRRQVMDWLKQQEVHQLYQETKTTKNIKPTVLKKPYAQIAIDLIDYQTHAYNGYKYILVAYDLFSKKVWAEPLKDKEGETVSIGMSKILKDMQKKPSTIRHDVGSEFKSEDFEKLMKKEGIKQIFSSPGKPQSNGGVERMNGTLKRLLSKIRSQEDADDWINYLEIAVDNINETVNRVTGKSPNEIEAESEDKYKDTEKKIKKEVLPKNKNELQTDIKAGDTVRIKMKNINFSKGGYNWSKELYKVSKVTVPGPSSSVNSVSFRIIDPETKKPFKDIFYANDVQKIEEVHNKIAEPEKYVISKIIRPVMRKIRTKYVKYYEVKWKGYSRTTLEPRSELEKDVPKILANADKELDVQWSKTSVKWKK
ncbi:TPA_asm: integrase [Monosiga MELD virus 2]|nr:TPA_asm: integrase [Monosiga MELD virus 2]